MTLLFLKWMSLFVIVVLGNYVFAKANLVSQYYIIADFTA